MRVTDEVTPATITIQWYVVSFASGVRVQRGETAQDALTKNVTLPLTLSSVNQAFVTWSKTPTNTDTTWDGNDYVLADITSTTNLQFRTDGIAATHTIAWQVIEFTDAADIGVQRGSVAMTTAQTSVTATLGTAVDENKTFVLVGLRTGASAAANVGAMLLRAQLTNSTTVTIDRSTVGGPAVAITEIAWQAIELRDASFVWSGNSSFAAGVAQSAVPLVPQVNVPRAIAFGSVQGGSGQNMGRSPYVGDDLPGVAAATATLSSTQLTLDRTNTAAAADVGWFVVEFDQGAANVVSGAYTGNGVDNRTIEVGFVPDFVFVKSNTTDVGVFRSSTMSGDNAKDSTGATALTADLIQSFTSAGLGGFTVGTDAQVNANGTVYTWTAFKTGPGKMAVGSYVGTGAASPPPVTGLGFSPELVYIMSAGAHEPINRSSAGGTFDFDVSADLASVTSLNADGFTVANQARVNAASTTYHWVAWNEAAGYLDVGSYTGNGAASQDITTVGFEPEFLYVKKDEATFFAYQRSSALAAGGTDLTGVYDNFAPVAARIVALLSNGFRVSNSVNVNETGDTFLYHAFKREAQPILVTGDYDGTGANQTINQLGFVPDVVIVKQRNGATQRIAFIRTSTMAATQSKPMTGATGMVTTAITSFVANGFTIGTNAAINTNLVIHDFIAFKAAPSTMKVGTYTGTGGANTITGVGFQPELVFVMRDGLIEAIHQNNLTAEAHNFLNSAGTAGLFTAGNPDGFAVATTDARVNQSGVTYHYIAWNEIPGFMDVGSYATGGAPVDNTNITGVGFEPEYVIVKQTDGQNAVHHPGSLGRSVDSTLFFGATAAAGNLVQALQPDGFQIGLGAQVNAASTTYFYYAWKRPFVSALTAVRLTSIDATCYDRGVLLQWRTGYEIDNLGFHVYREVGGQRTRVTRSLVAGSGLMAGQGTPVTGERRYAVWDLDGASTDPSAVYWLRDVDFHGSSTWHGPIAPVHQGRRAAPDVAQSEALHQVFGGTRDGAKRAGTVFLSQGAALEDARNGPPQGPMPGVDARWELAAGPAVKIGISRPGWYRVPQPALVAAGLDPTVNPRMLRLFIEGVEQAMIVTGDADGRFDAADAIEFYGSGTDTPSTDTRVYWLTAGSQPGRRVQGQIQGQPGRSLVEPTPGSFAFTVQRKERSVYFAALRNGDAENWFGPLVSEDPIDVAIDVTNLDAAAGAELEVTLQGVTVDPDLTPNHLVGILVNGVEVGELSFDGQANSVQTLQVASGILVEGENTIRLVARAGAADMSLLDVIRLRYAHTYRADADLLRLTVDGPATISVAGFTGSAIRVLDVTEPLSPEELRVTTGQSGGLWTATARALAGGPRTLMAFTGSAVLTPAYVRRNQPSSWHSSHNSADYVAISHASFMDWIAPLADRRWQQGHAPARIDVEDIYDEFSFGEKNPQALKDFMRRALAAWTRPPRFLVLVGDATIDPRDYAAFGDADFVPTKQISLDHVALETASDEWFADVDDDGLPELAVGRLSVRNSAQAERMVAKILDYETEAGAAWIEDVLFVADENEPTDDYERSSRQLTALVPQGYAVQQVFAGTAGPDAARTALIDAVNEGRLIVNYTGHGSVSVWGKTGTLLTAQDVNDAWQNSTRLPLVVAMNCLNGFFNGIYDEESLGETLLRAPNGGAVAAWASSGLTESATQTLVNKELLRLLFADPAMTVGEAVTAAKRAVRDPDVRRTWIFFGDPALRLHRPPPPPSTEEDSVVEPPVEDGGPGGDPAVDEPEPTPDGAERAAEPVRLADFNGDARADVLLYEAETGRWSLTSSGSDGPRVTDGVWLAGAQVLAGRLDADRFDDVFLYAPASGEWMQALGNGDGTFRTTAGSWPAGWSVRISNFIGDGRGDVLLYQPLTGEWCLSDSLRRFTFRRCGLLAAGDLSVADYNRDSLADLFIADRAGSGRVALSDGFGGFTVDAEQWSTASPGRAANLAGDSAVDLVLYDPLLGTSAERLGRAGQSAFRTDAWPRALTIAPLDVTGDGADDLLLYDPRAGSWSVMTNTPSGLVASSDGVWSPGLTIATGDLDGDGRPDVLLHDREGRTWTVCTNQDPGTLACSASGVWDRGWAIVGR